MNLQIRDPRARELAEKLARRRDVSMTAAVIEALERRLEQPEPATREGPELSIAEIAGRLGDELRALGGDKVRDMTKEEIDAMWGQ